MCLKLKKLNGSRAMPNRILRDGILTSERVNALNWEAEVFYRRLMSVVDDYGRYTAHPALLRAALYPLKLDAVRDANMERLLALVEQARLVRVYVVDGKRYLELLDFKQQVRAKDSKYPHPPGVSTHLHSTCVADAKQVPAYAHLGGGVDEDVDDKYPPPNARAHEKPSKFSMSPDWKPSEHFSSIARMAGIELSSGALGEFVAYWLSRLDTERTQHEWDHALVKCLKADKARDGAKTERLKIGSKTGGRETFRERDSRLTAERVAAFAPGVAKLTTNPEIIEVEVRNAPVIEGD